MFTVKGAITSLGQARKPHHLLNCCEETPTWCGKTKPLTVTVIITVTVCGLVFPHHIGVSSQHINVP